MVRRARADATSSWPGPYWWTARDPARPVVRLQHAGRPARTARAVGDRAAEGGPQLLDGDAPVAQHGRRIDGDVDDGRLDADVGGTAVQHEVDVVTEVGADVGRRGGADSTESV